MDKRRWEENREKASRKAVKVKTFSVEHWCYVVIVLLSATQTQWIAGEFFSQEEKKSCKEKENKFS